MKQLFILSILSIVLFTSCKDNVDLAIDNPTDSSIEITLDTLIVFIPSKEIVRLEISKGEHQLTLENDSVIQFNFIESAYMINPSLSEYLVSEEYFGPEEYAENFTSKILKKEVTFHGMSLKGNYEVIKDVVNKVTWDFGPREILPGKIEIEEDKTYTSLIKVYDSAEFMDILLNKSIH